MSLYKELVDPSHTIERLTFDRLADVVKAGRSNCFLSTKKAEHEGAHLRPVDEAVRQALTAIARNKAESDSTVTV